jgi:hypothetical protein
MSGVAAANSRRAYKHTLKYALVAAILPVSCLPCNLLAYAISLLASLHALVNHGARVFPHLLGFLGEDILISFTTPAFTASYSKKISTAAARSSLLRAVSFTRSLKSFINSYDPVCFVHCYADVA